MERILETHPCETLSCLEMSQCLTPLWASSTIRCLTISGRGLPLTNAPPSWLTPPWPGKKLKGKPYIFSNNTTQNKVSFFSMFEVWDSGWPTHIQWLFGNNNVLLKNISESGQKNGNYVRFFFLTNLSYLSFLCPKFDIFSKVIQTDNEYGRCHNLYKQIPI